MKNKLLALLLIATFFLSGCGDDEQRTYKMTLVTGEEIVVEYERCLPYDSGVGCWEDYPDVSSSIRLVPDAFYLVSSFEEIE